MWERTMKTEDQIRKRLNKLIVDYFNGKFEYNEKKLAEERIRELVWVSDETILINNDEAKLIGKKKK